MIMNETPADDTNPTSPRPDITNPADEIKTPKGNKTPLIIAIVAILIIITACIISLAILNRPKAEELKGEPTEPLQTKNSPLDNAEFKDKNRLKKDSYTIADINEGFSFATISFTGSSNIRLNDIKSEESQTPEYEFAVYTNDGNKDYLVNITLISSRDTHQTIETVNETCEKQTSCNSDYIDGAKTLLTTIRSSYGNDYYFYSATKSGQLISYHTNNYEEKSLDESAARKLLVKTAMSISDDNGSPYLVDMAMLLNYPDNRYVKSYHDIARISDDTVLVRPTSSEEPVNILAFQSPIEHVKLKEVSSNPRIDSFTYYSTPHDPIASTVMDYTFFRFYDNGPSVDITIYLSDGKNITELDEVQKYLDLLGK